MPYYTIFFFITLGFAFSFVPKLKFKALFIALGINFLMILPIWLGYHYGNLFVNDLIIATFIFLIALVIFHSIHRMKVWPLTLTTTLVTLLLFSSFVYHFNYVFYRTSQNEIIDGNYVKSKEFYHYLITEGEWTAYGERFNKLYFNGLFTKNMKPRILLDKKSMKLSNRSFSEMDTIILTYELLDGSKLIKTMITELPTTYRIEK